jgi:hypothetical protein
LAGVPGFEPGTLVLETSMLPITPYSRMLLPQGTRIPKAGIEPARGVSPQ